MLAESWWRWGVLPSVLCFGKLYFKPISPTLLWLTWSFLLLSVHVCHHFTLSSYTSTFHKSTSFLYPRFHYSFLITHSGTRLTNGVFTFKTFRLQEVEHLDHKIISMLTFSENTATCGYQKKQSQGECCLSHAH